jgi:hypothetical protein
VIGEQLLQRFDLQKIPRRVGVFVERWQLLGERLTHESVGGSHARAVRHCERGIRDDRLIAFCVDAQRKAAVEVAQQRLVGARDVVGEATLQALDHALGFPSQHRLIHPEYLAGVRQHRLVAGKVDDAFHAGTLRRRDERQAISSRTQRTRQKAHLCKPAPNIDQTFAGSAFANQSVTAPVGVRTRRQFT